MKANHTQLAVILDRSGSMANIRQGTIDAYNEFIGSQKATPGTANVMLVQFDDTVETIYNESLENVPMLNWDTFVPRGWTALHDAIGITINDLGKTFSELPESERPEHVIIAVFTDGGENKSKEYKNAIAPLIKEQREKYNWEFNFFGANQDAIAVSQAMNIPQDRSYSFSGTSASMANTMGAATYMVNATRLGTKLKSSQIGRIREITGQSACMSFEDIRKEVDNA